MCARESHYINVFSFFSFFFSFHFIYSCIIHLSTHLSVYIYLALSVSAFISIYFSVRSFHSTFPLIYFAPLLIVSLFTLPRFVILFYRAINHGVRVLISLSCLYICYLSTHTYLTFQLNPHQVKVDIQVSGKGNNRRHH